MKPTLTVLVPNYNRPKSLKRLLTGVFASIEQANAHDRVQVLVVDDFSEDDPAPAIAPFQARSNFRFTTQAKKCGNAELAFLDALHGVTTDYVWLLGNDDQILVTAIATVLDLLAYDAGFILLNPQMLRKRRIFTPLGATHDIVAYQRGEELFLDFGFVTSTTTFPCLVMKASPLRDFHRAHELTAHSSVYSHTFSMFGAVRDAPALFYAPPIVTFNLNEEKAEMVKLRRQAQDRTAYFHQSLGLARLIRGTSEATGVPVETFGWAREDELSKATLKIESTYLSHFLLFFMILQFREDNQARRTASDHRPMLPAEIDEVAALMVEFRQPDLLGIFEEAVAVHRAAALSREWKFGFLSSAIGRSKEAVTRAKVLDPRAAGRGTAHKVFTSTFGATFLSGRGVVRAGPHKI